MSRKTYPMKWLNSLLKVRSTIDRIFHYLYFTAWPKSIPMVQKETDTYDDPEKAYLETKKALLLISHHLNTGDKLYHGDRKLNKAEQLINSKADKK